MRRRSPRGSATPEETSSASIRSLDKNKESVMCRNIKTLANFAPPATEDEIRASALQFVRKLSGMNKPSRANQDVFDHAVDEVTAAANRLVHALVTTAPPRDREEEARKARERSMERFGR